MNRSSRQQAFTLVELMIVVAVIAVIAAMAIPSLLNARKAANEATIVGFLRTLATINNQFMARHGTYIVNNAPFDTSVYSLVEAARGVSDVYAGQYVGGEFRWEATAWPRQPGVTADRSFYIDTTGVIRVALSGQADSTSPPIQ